MRTVTVANEELLPEIAELLSTGSSVILGAKGNSMLPFIMGSRDSVVLKKADVLHVGDIVLAEMASVKFVLHRIVKMENELITLMGDGNLRGTEKCRKENIRGKAIAVIKKGRRIDCNTKSERLKALIWQKLLPLRRYLLAIYKLRIGN